MSEHYLLGGYTKRANDGLYQITFDRTRQCFKDYHQIYRLGNPTYGTINRDGSLLLTVCTKNKQGGVAAFTRKGNTWVLVDQIYYAPRAGCHLTYCETSSTIYVANYHTGSIDILTWRQNKLSFMESVSPKSSSTNDNSKSSHIHYVGLNQTEKLLFVCDLGYDQVLTYQIMPEGNLDLQSSFNLPSGTGPRHLVMHPIEPYLYIVGELNNTLSIVSYDVAGNLALVDSHKNVTQQICPDSSGAAIRISEDGRFLYVSTRYANIITVYELLDFGFRLIRRQEIDTGGQVPRDFVISPDQKHLMIVHQDSDHISRMARDSQTGLLKLISSDTPAPECVYIQAFDATPLP